MSNLFKTKILTIENHTENLKSFEISIPKDVMWEFKPGQYVDIAQPDQPDNFCGFSLTSIPSQKSKFSISIKKTDNSLTWYLFQSAIGDDVIVRGPAGDFSVDYNQTPKAILVGGGIGVTPLISMFRTALNHPQKPEVAFFHSAKYESELLFYKEFIEIVKDNSNFSYYYTVTRQTNWTGASMRFTPEFVFSKLDQQLSSECDYYICGPGTMNSEFEKKLVAKGINKNKIHLESYYEP